jgi:G:T-mismatch repair DNA endonuclease (very short patch repair protein)
MVSDKEIQHAENLGEFRIPSTQWTVDGYNSHTTTVYEFQGDFWHGNPKRFNPEEINPRNGIIFGDLYKKTMNKNEALRNMGYTVIDVWESDWDRGICAVVAVQRLFKGRV